MRSGDALPGIRVDVAPRPPRSALPRMDVPAFVGFAARGPCHRAISVTSVAAFEAVFGGDCPLAIDPQTGIALRANLPASVRSFFANGGRRCWVIRAAVTTELIEQLEAQGAATTDLQPAQAGLFAMPGLLSRTPSAEGDASLVAPAMLSAASLGSWSDSLRLAARISRRPIEVKDLAEMRWGLRFADRGILVPGDLIELTGASGLTTRYAKIVSSRDGQVFACSVASLLRISKPTPVKTGHVTISGEAGVHAATFQEGAAPFLALTGGPNEALKRGRWAHFSQQGESIWLRIDRVDGAVASGPAWQQVRSRMPTAPWSAARLTLDLREYLPSGDRTHAGLALTPERDDSIQSILDADHFHAYPANRTTAIRPAFAATRAERERVALGYGMDGFAAVAGRFGTSAFTAADRVALRSAWLPIGLTEAFAEPAAPLPTGIDPLVRDGLMVVDERLFLDPRLAREGAATINERAEAILQDENAVLMGIHGALGAGVDLFPEPSLLTVPDASQPDWTEGVKKDVPDPVPGISVPSIWINHAGGCPPNETASEITGPDDSRFLDCTIELLPAPELTAPTPIRPDTSFLLSWPVQPPGTVAILEESGRPDFAGAAEILRGELNSKTIGGKREGLFYYRLRVERDGNASSWSAAAVEVRGSRFVAGEFNEGRTRRLHLAMLRLAGGSGELFALLTMPQKFRTAQAVDHARSLRALAPGAGNLDRLGADEERLLSFGALYHPWLVGGIEAGLVSIPADGAIAGLMAAKALDQGAWVAPANDPINGLLGLDTQSPIAELIDLDRARINMIRKLGMGLAPQDAVTLSSEPGWLQVNVRRLMILLRRVVMQRGMTYLFEPNGPVLRRAVERDIGSTFDDLQSRGAFAGRLSAQSFRIAVQDQPSDFDAGRLIIELAVAPAEPMAFLTLRLVRRGDGMTVVEEG
ncbi:MAG TPA: phage tail sheath C-terminal domain-containing protein [Sphingomicrobium sp.]